MILIYFHNIVSEFYENIYLSNWLPYIAEKKLRYTEEFNIIPNGKQNFFFKTVRPPFDTGIPLKHDYIFIKEVDTHNGISYHGGGRDDVIHVFWYLGKGGMKVTRY